MKRVLFLYIVFSSGHQRAAEALKEAFNSLYPDILSLEINSFDYAYPVLGKMVRRTYTELIKRTPQIWDYLYDNRNIVDATAEIRELLSRLNSKKFRKLLENFEPDAIVCTQAAPCAVIAGLKKSHGVPSRLIAVLTDYKAHAYWIFKEVDLYIVATQQVKEDLIHRGIKQDRIKVTGIPIDPKFIPLLDQEKCRARLKLNPSLFTILIMGGGPGLGPIDEILKALKNIALPFQVIVITGRNKKLYHSLKKTCKKFTFPIKFLGYTKNIEKVMRASDIIITKPGGMTASEALATELPMIIVKPIPGQEEGNSRFLLDQNVALRLDNIKNLPSMITDLISHPVKLQRLKTHSKNLGRPDSAIQAARQIMNLFVKE